MRKNLKAEALVRNEAKQAFFNHENNLKTEIVEKLRSAAKWHQKINPTDTLLKKQHTILSQLLRAFEATSSASLSYEYEVVVPLSEEYKKMSFHEALVRLHDENGDLISPDELFDTLDNQGFTDHLGMRFRIWLMTAQIKDFYNNRAITDRLSLNISLRKMHYNGLSKSFEQTLKLSKASGHNIILEALENNSWGKNKSARLSELVENFCTAIAIDDYGDDKGCHTVNTLHVFNKHSTTLFIKLDGRLIRDFLDNNNEALINRLREIKKVTPHAPVIAEWVSSADEAVSLKSRLKPYDLEHAIHAVQGRNIKDTPAGFLEKLNSVPLPA